MRSELERFVREIEKIEDAGELRLRLVALMEENIQLRNRESERISSEKEKSVLFQQMENELKGLRKENDDLKKKLRKAQDNNALKTNKVFGRQTEKLSDLMDQAENGCPPSDPIAEDAQEGDGTSADNTGNKEGEKESGRTRGKRRKGKRKEDLSKLPRHVDYDYDEEELDRIFGKGRWRIIDWHSTVKKEYLPAVVYAHEIKTPVVSVGLEHTMECLPPKNILLPGSDATASLVAAIMNNKFSLALPLDRQAREMARHGVALSKQTMSNWVIRFSTEMFVQVYAHLAGKLKESGCTQCDETTILVIRDGRRAGRKSYMWVHITSELGTEKPIALFSYEPDRSADHLRDFYDDYIGAIICDAYVAYRAFESENGDRIILGGCWMHSRRRWAEALRVRDVKGLSREEIDRLPEATALRLISEIYRAENPLKEISATERLSGRKSAVKEKVEAYYSFIEGIDLEDPAVSEKMADAIQYSLNQKEYLCRFLTDGNIPMDNGACERTIRALAVGRANWLFATSPRGAESAAIMYSLVETAKMNGANAYYYLKYLLENAPSSPNLKVSGNYLDSLMPWSDEYRKYEAAEKKKVFEIRIPPSQPEPVRKKQKKTAAA